MTAATNANETSLTNVTEFSKPEPSDFNDTHVTLTTPTESDFETLNPPPDGGLTAWLVCAGVSVTRCQNV